MTEGQSSRHEEIRQSEDDQVLLIGRGDLQQTLSQLNEESKMKQKGIVAPYPFTWKGLSPQVQTTQPAVF